MTIIPIRLRSPELHIHADQRLAFQVITAFGVPQPNSEGSSRVLSREGSRLLAEFHTPGRGVLGGRKVYRTVEWVTPHEPERVDFETVEGPLSMMRDRFLLKKRGECAGLLYEAEFGIKGWLAGWVLSWLLVRPMLRRLMREHMMEMKDTIEARARNSRLFPQLPCPWERGEVNGDE